jgi:ribonuclease R
MYVEGLIHVTELGGEYFKFDEVRQELRGERTGLRYVIGSRVRVQVSRVDLDGRKIDFRLVREGEAVRLPSGGIVRLEAHDDSSGKPAKRRDKGGPREGAREHGRDTGRDTGRDSDRELNRDVPQPASRKTASRSPSKASARAPASPIQALRAAVKKAAAKGKGKRRR